MSRLLSRKEKKTSKKRFTFHYQYSVHLIIFLVAIVSGTLYSFYLLGEQIDPLNTQWLFNNTDPALYVISWSYFRGDPWHWPLTFSESLAYPTGGNISYTDIAPLWAIPLKLLSPWLPEKFQYFGIFMMLNFILQFFWGAQLGLLFSRKNLFFAVVSGLFFLIAPPLTWRVHGHFILTSHWLILASLWSFWAIQVPRMLKITLFIQSTILGIATGINPYLAVFSFFLISLSFIQLFVCKKLKLTQSVILILGAVILLLLGWFVWGFLPTEDSSENMGYGAYSLNLLSIFDPHYPSLFLKPLPTFSPFQHYEGFNYLGLGVLLLFFANLIRAISQFKQWKNLENNLKKWITRYGLICLLMIGLTVFALSNKVAIGDHLLLEYPLPPLLGDLFIKFRASGRFFWPCYYIILLGVLVSTLKLWKPQQFKFILPLILLIQFADLWPINASVTAWMQSPVQQESPVLKSDSWQQLSKDHNKLLIIPSNQCLDAKNTPPAPYPLFEKIAVLEKMKTNSAYLARYSPETLDIHCKQLPDQFKQGKLEEDAAYVVSRNFLSEAVQINKNENSSHFCHILDGYILCQNKKSLLTQENFNLLIPVYVLNTLLDFRGLDNSSLSYQGKGWSAPDLQGIGGTWTEGDEARLLMTIETPSSTLIHSSPSISMKAKVIPLMNENHPQQIADIVVNGKVIDRWVFNFPFTPDQSQRHTVIPSELIKENEPLEIVFRIQNPVSPKDIGYNEDPRVLSLNFETLELLSIYEKEN